MDEYEKINNQIKQLMNTSVTQGECTLPPKEESSVDHLIKILSDLIRVYKDIQFMLESNDQDGIKNKLLKDDIKISLVCESLMKILKEECTEKKEAYRLLEEEKNKIKSLEGENDEMRHKIRKIESDVQYLSNGNKELNRIIQDQKMRVQTFRDKADLETKGADAVRAINKELEKLRQKALDKNEILVKEINVLRTRLEEKDKTIRKLNEEIKKHILEIKSTGEKCFCLEKANLNLRKKLEGKEKALDVCNSELAKLISKNKKLENTNEDVQGKAAYYERLYKAINKQNEYLNEQLARLINIENVDKIEVDLNSINNNLSTSLVTATSDIKKIKTYKRRLKKYKKKYNTTQEEIEKNKEELKNVRRMIERIKNENKRLQDEKEKAIESNNQVTDTLLNKVEKLLEKNKEYQKILLEQQEDEGRDIDIDREINRDNYMNDRDTRVSRDNNIMNDKDNNYMNDRDNNYMNDRDNVFNKDTNVMNENIVNESFRTVQEEVKDNNYPYNNNNNLQSLDTMFSEIRLKNTNDKVRDFDSSTLFLDDGRKYQRSFRLQNDYETEKSIQKPKEIKPVNERSVIPPLKIPDSFYTSLVRQANGGVMNDVDLLRVNGNSPSPRAKHPYSPLQTKDAYPPLETKDAYPPLETKDAYPPTQTKDAYPPTQTKDAYPPFKTNFTDFKLTDKESDEAEIKSLDSGKSLQTTSTLKEMRRKTENLQNKFDDLEKQLEEIKKSDDPHPKKLHDQIKAYTDYYYSDYLDFSNDDDFM